MFSLSMPIVRFNLDFSPFAHSKVWKESVRDDKHEYCLDSETAPYQSSINQVFKWVSSTIILPGPIIILMS